MTPPRYLRKEFSLPKPVRRATIYASALGLYEIHMNGQRVDLSAVRSTVSQMRLKSPDAPVVVVADESARVFLIVRVIDECRLAGAEEISLATRGEGA